MNKRILGILITVGMTVSVCGCDMPKSVQTTGSPGESSGVSASSQQGKEELSIDRQATVTDEQIKLLAEEWKKWTCFYRGVSEYYYAVTDLDQNGRWEILVSTGLQGSGRYTFSDYYQVDETGKTLKKCKTNYQEGDSQEDIVNGINTAYHDPDTDTYYYLSWDFASAGSMADNWYGICSLTLKEDRVISNGALAYRDGVWQKKKDRRKYTYYQYIDGKEEKIWEGDFNKDKIGDEAYPNYEKMSVNISWFQIEEKKKDLTQEKLLSYLQKSSQEFWLGYGVKQEEMSFWDYPLRVPQLTGMEDEEKQERLNRMIRDAVEKNLDERLDLTNDPEQRKNFGIADFTGTVKYGGRDKLSLLMVVDGMGKGAAHPFAWAYTINLDLEQGSMIDRENILSSEYKQDIKKVILEGPCDEIKDVGYRKMLQRVEKKLKKIKKKKRKQSVWWINSWEENWDECEFYLTKDRIGVVIPTIYALGNYSIYEVYRSDFS